MKVTSLLYTLALVTYTDAASLTPNKLLPNQVGTDPTVYVSDYTLQKMLKMARGEETIDINSLVRTHNEPLKDALNNAIKALQNGLGTEPQQPLELNPKDPTSSDSENGELEERFTIGKLITNARKYNLDAGEITSLKRLESGRLVTAGIINRYISKQHRAALRSAAGLQ